MKATDLLSKQHRNVEAIFKKLEAGKADPAPLLEALSNALAAHMAIEQEIFYPEVKAVDEDLILEAFEEHSLAELGLKRLLATSPEDPSFQARVVACKELIEHHVEEEEEELFPKVEKAIDAVRLEAMGKAMKARFEAVEAAGFEAAVPKGFGKTSADVAKSSAKTPQAPKSASSKSKSSTSSSNGKSAKSERGARRATAP